MSRPEHDRVQQSRTAAHEARRYVHRRRFGTVGTEPPEGRSELRQWGSISIGIVALIVSFVVIEVGAALAAVSFILGAPRSWTWANDKLSSLTWVVGVLTLVVGEILFVVGSPSIRQTPGHGHGAGAASVLIGLSSLVAIAGYYRRWGTPGNVAYWDRQLRKGDPEAAAYGARLQKARGRHYDDEGQ